MRQGGTTPQGVRWLSYSVPLRPDFIASIDLPRDLTSAEAERLAAFIQTLVIPAQQSESLVPLPPGAKE